MRISDWRSDVCSSDRLSDREIERAVGPGEATAERRSAFEDQAHRALEEKFAVFDPVGARDFHGAAGLGIPQHGAGAELRMELRQAECRAIERHPDPLKLSHEAVEQQGDAVLPESHRQRSEEHTSELQSLMRISYAVFCLKKK